MFDWIQWLFDDSPFVPRPDCGGWSQELIWLTVTADCLIWLAYMAIPFLLWQVIRKRPDVPERALFLLFIVFIASCGVTHFLDMLTFYQPVYRVNGVVLAITALISWVTVLVMTPRLPRLLAMKSPEVLQAEIDRRMPVEKELRAVTATLERRVAERTRELERSNADLEEFAYVASHDLQEPLRKVTAFSEMLAEDLGEQLSESAREYLARMQGAASRMRTMIDDLLQLSRASKRAEQRANVKLNDLVAAVVQDLETSLIETGAQVEVGNLGTVHVAPVAVSQVFINLLGNAIKYRRKDVPLRIRISSREVETGMLELSVEDNGIGFEQVFAERIFKPFERLHSREEYPGTGIGLAVCRKIIERHGGRISAEGRPGHGATFRFTVPKETT